MKIKTIAAVTLGVIVLVAGGLWGGVKYYQSRSPRHLMKNHSGERVAVEELSYFDGLNKIYGKIYKPEADEFGKRPALVFCHGLGVNADFGDKYCKEAVAQGYVAYAFDFRGGSPDSRSTGMDMTGMSVLTEKEDLEFVLSHLRRERFVRKSEIYLAGHSQGGLVASITAAEQKSKIAGLILLAPAFNIPADGKSRYKKVADIPDTTLWGACTLGKKYYKDIRSMDPYKTIGKYRGDVLIVHGTGDRAVPAECSEKAAESYRSVSIEILPGADHNFTGSSSAKVISLMKAYLKEHF